MMFDNDFHNLTDINDTSSTLLEVTLNEQNRTAQETWSWEAPEEYYSPYWGEADVLPNRDRIGTFGTQVKTYDDGVGAVIVEVNQTGQVVRTWTFPEGWGIYRVAPGTPVPTSLGIYPEISQEESIAEYNFAPVTVVVIMVLLTPFAALYIRRRRRVQ
jgi:hypothetical protein